jgi:hypothetical protein
VRVKGRIRAAGAFDDASKPDVSVNGSPANVFKGGSPGPFCNTPFGICWGDFEANAVSLLEGAATITAIGVDNLGRSASAAVSGIVDVCVDGDSDGPARVGAGQSNRSHQVDGCSTPDIVAPDVPPVPERFPHGAQPRDRLPCNLHDVCCQTCGFVKADCDKEMYERMNEACRAAYPESICPYTVDGPFGTRVLDPVECPRWRDERDRCYYWARTYRAGRASLPAASRFDLRQSEYCE